MILLTLSELETALEELQIYFLKQTHIVLQIAGIGLLQVPHGPQELDFTVASAGCQWRSTFHLHSPHI